jgi:SSS family transporter
MNAWLLDAFVILAYFLLIIGVGLYMGRREESLHDFALGGRRMPWWAVLASIIAAETSAATFIGTPGEGYALRNYTYTQLAFGTILARVLVALLFLQPYYHHNVYSIYEFLTVRFGTASKNAASAVFLITRVLASGARIYVAAVILVLAYEMFTGVQPDTREEFLIYFWSIVAITAITALYTTFGGIKAVIWTDMIQATIMMTSALAAIVILYRHIPNGWSGLSATLDNFKEVNLLDSGLRPGRTFWENVKGILESEYTIWAALFGSTFTTMGTHGTDQDMVQRMLTAPDVKRSRRSVILSGLADIPIVLTFLTIGILLWVFYQTNPDPNLPKKANEVFCYFILHQLPVGIRGLLVAGIFATTMGSLSAALNALATSFTRDWYMPFLNPRAGDARALLFVRVATVIFSLLMIAIAAAAAYLVILHPERRIIPMVLGIIGYTYGSLLGVFLVGMLTKRRGNDFGNVLAMILGFIVVAFLSGLPNDLARAFHARLYEQPAWLPVIEFPWRVMFGTIVTFAVAICFRSPVAPPSHLRAEVA